MENDVLLDELPQIGDSPNVEHQFLADGVLGPLGGLIDTFLSSREISVEIEGSL